MKLLFIYLCCLPSSLYASTEAIDQLFSKLPMEGSIVISNLDGSIYQTYNRERASKSFTVASTFKIPNSIIAIEKGIVSNLSDTFIWDGTQHQVKSWNKDQTFQSAFKRSCVWCYQEIARKVGSKTYREYLNSFQYGALPKVFSLDQFWLDGSLQLTSHQQIEFLKKLKHQTLPLKEPTYDLLKDIMRVDSTGPVAFYAKTGWSPYGEFPVGWYVGYVEINNETWFFATNLAVKAMKHLKYRQSVTLEVLKIMGAIPREVEFNE